MINYQLINYIYINKKFPSPKPSFIYSPFDLDNMELYYKFK